MQLGSLTEFLVKSLVKNPDMVSVKVFDDEDKITIEVLVSSEDMGRVIGRQGKVANSIRTVMKALGSRDRKRVNIEFLD